MKDDVDLCIQASVDTCNSEVRRRKDDIDRLRVHAAVYGYDVAASVPYDGDCFFHAVAHFIEGSNSTQIRSDLLSFLETKVGANYSFYVVMCNSFIHIHNV